MVEKPFDWANGATLEEHSRRKHKILREYVSRYLAVRCQHPKREKFRLAIIDGFSGGGRYKCGAGGSPIIFIEEVKHALSSINLGRTTQGLKSIQIECFLVFNDPEPGVIDILRENITPIIADEKESSPGLHIQIEYMQEPFESAYKVIKELLSQGRYRNVIFNLDQCGHKDIEQGTLLDIMRTFTSAEIFYTFAIKTLVSFLNKTQPELLAKQTAHIGLGSGELSELDGPMSRSDWLGAAERIVFETFRNCAPYVSTFSINNPKGIKQPEVWTFGFELISHPVFPI